VFVVPSSTTQVSIYVLDEIKGLTYWNRRLLKKSVQKSYEATKHPTTKSYEALEAVVKFTKSKAQANRSSGAFTAEEQAHTKRLPDIVHTFYENVDWMLPC
jgi:hypothetical protein